MKTKLFTLGIIFMMLCVALTACFGNQQDTSVTTSKVTEPPVVKHTVTFLNGEDTYKTVEVVEGEAVSEPEVPSKAGTESTYFVFDGWYNGETKWDFANKITADVILNAKFTEETNTYEVKILDVNGNTVSTSEVTHGTKLTQPETPETPVEAGTTFTFDGWYNGNAKWDFENVEVTSDVSLKPVFASEKIDVIITFNMDDGTLIETVTVKYGETPNCSVTPTKEDAEGKHYELAGWDKEVAPAVEATTYVAAFKEYSVGIGNTDTFAANTIYKNVENKYINASYNYSSISGSYFPIVVNNEALVFNVFSTDDTGVLNIDFGSVKAGVTYYVSLNLIMKDADGNLLTDGFAYAFATVPDKTASDAALLTPYALLTVNGQNGFLITPTADVEHLYLSIRTQRDKGYMESTATIDDVCIKEVNLSGADISNGNVSEDFSDGIVVSEGNSTIWYGDVKVYSPNLNATVVSSDGKLLVSAEKSGQKGLVGFYISGVEAGKSYEVSMDLKLFDADKSDATSSFTMMVCYGNINADPRYPLYLGDGDTNLGTAVAATSIINNGKAYFKFTATQDGYVIIALRANSSPLYAEIDNFSMKEVPTYAFITFKNEEGTVIDTVKYESGSEIEVPGALTKDSSETTTYTFDGWYSGETKLVAGTQATVSATYTAKFTESARKYTVTYYNQDDTVYQTVEVAYGETFTLIEAPTSDGKVGTWVGDVYATMPAQDISYKLSYSVTSYTASITVNGEAYNNYTYTVENREAVRETILGLFANDAQYTYSYANVPAELPLESATYDIVRTVNQYTVKFVVDGEVQETLTLDYGATPTTTLAPTKDDYTFTGWTPAIATVTGDATYTAVFTANSLDVTETFESGSISNKNYMGSDLSGYIPNTNSSIALVEYNGSNALAVSKLGTITSSGYFGMKVDVKPNTTYVVTLDLAATGASTTDLSSSSLISFEVFENANIGTNTSRLTLYSNTGCWLNTNQKISSFLVSGTSYQVVFTTSDFDGESGYVYFTLRLNSTLTEDATVYLDNLRVNECVTHINESFDDVTEITDTVAKGANSTVTVENGALKATCTASKQGFLGVYVKVEAGKTYIVHFDATVTGADGTDYSTGTSSGSSATIMVFQNNSGFNNTYRVNYMASKANATVSNTPLPNVLNTAVPNYCLTFTATEDGYVYIALRTNNIAQESYITFDNLLVSELELD